MKSNGRGKNEPSRREEKAGMRGRSWDLRRCDNIDSTNLEAKRLLAGGAAAGLVVTARHQTAGRGRLGREWLDLPGKSLIVSMVLEDVEPFEAVMLVAVSARAAVVSLGGGGPRIKWPNDLVYGRRKVGGILSETCAEGLGRYVVVGLGMNVSYLPEELSLAAKLPPTSLLIEEGMILGTEELLQALLREVEARGSRDGNPLREEYHRHLAYLGKRVRVEHFTRHPEASPDAAGRAAEGGGPDFVEGVLAGVDELGNLLLRAEGETHRLIAGDLIPLP